MVPVLTRVTGRLGRIVLNRPRAINALNADMVAALHTVLDRWEHSPRVRAILVTGAGDRGLCAGGDLRVFHADALSGGTASLDFWAEEYRLNARIAAYPKPIVAWMDGLVMGGGIGIGGHAGVRLVTERSRLAMPEVGIGFHPDVGGSRLLALAPGRTGLHLALTGGSIGAGDAIYTGLADHYVPSSRLPSLALELHDGEVPGFTAPVPDGELAAARDWIDDCYAAPDIAGILARLRDHPAPGARAAAKEIEGKSPTSLAVTLRSVREAAALPSLEAVLDREFRLSAALLRTHDLAEGIRAQIIDKDRDPRWAPVGDVDALFAPGERELGLVH
ncbi:enoyl-CoA hydratase/isomerase family protein [Phytomonospora endophytica]|uniref:3-hydroxyisobutyryl-CoA hydrolase n=1 Tax=Phytomonospora endophytica TaxID=714109 RepID=A0A841G043_9ACTN|nr:enoyl-CoA hydratase/isomerase family protein [Phytomonospora endophytica]MBB6038059.1 enoyl-CoA hydratase [Phytomonospora endophytica]GIG67477.1 putative enoyl-CoA hydratase [Phytomonospora endophytica]